MKTLTLATHNPTPHSDSPILTDSAAELMEVFREKSNYEGVVSVYEAMKTRGVTPGAKVPIMTQPHSHTIPHPVTWALHSYRALSTAPEV